MTPEQLFQIVAVVLGPAGAAYVGVRTAVNGMRADVKEIKGDVKELRGDVAKHGERLAVLETRET